MGLIQKTTVILLSTSTLDLNLAMTRAYRLSGNLFHTGLTRAVQLMKNYTPFGSVDTEIVTISVWLTHSLNLGYVFPHPTPSVGVLEKELRRS